jgi:hypothetical protein
MEATRMAEQLNTIITLRQGTTAEWATSTIVLKTGEMGLEYRADGTVKIKAGDGEHLWGDLAYIGSDIKAANVIQVELGATETDDIAAIEAKVTTTGAVKQNGDVAIVKSTFADGKISYTSYVYDSELDVDGEDSSHGWSAMDGNYSATNVFIKNDITLAGGFTSIGNYSKGKKLNKGTSLESILSGMLQQEIYPGDSGYAIDLPSASISVSGSSGTVEVGNTFTLPTATLKITDVGSYPFEPKATGITFPAESVTLSQGGNTAKNSAALGANGTVTLQATGTDTTYGDSDVSFTFTGTAAYSASNVTPKTNLGNEYASKKIAAGSCTVSSQTAKFKGYRKWFYGGDTKTDFASDTIRALTNSTAAVSGQTFELKAASYSGCSRIVIAIPANGGKVLKEVLLKSSSNADITGEFKQINTATNVINVAGYNGYTPISYNVWEYKPAALDSTEVYTIKIG